VTLNRYALPGALFRNAEVPLFLFAVAVAASPKKKSPRVRSFSSGSARGFAYLIKIVSNSQPNAAHVVARTSQKTRMPNWYLLASALNLSIN
jgi:hypothetical protein